MIYLRSFLPSNRKVSHPNLYPYQVLSGRCSEPLEFSPITVLYGTNGSGKSTLLNIIAGTLKLKGTERLRYGQEFVDRYMTECRYTLGCSEEGRTRRIPEESQYIKSEDLLFEIKRIQQEEALQRGYIYEEYRKGIPVEETEQRIYNASGQLSGEGMRIMEYLSFRQEKYSNGETALQLLEDRIQPGGLYLLDEPEVSLSLQNQLELAERLNNLARFFDCQFIIATHSPIMLAKLRAVIYNMDLPHIREARWFELENVRFLYDFFQQYRHLFDTNSLSNY